MYNVIPHKPTTLNVNFAKDITIIRAFIYSLVCDVNSSRISVEAILAGCNRYGIDNPCPIINKRMSLYGVPDDLVKEFKNLAKTYNEQCPGLNIDPDVLGPAELETGTRMEYTRQI